MEAEYHQRDGEGATIVPEHRSHDDLVRRNLLQTKLVRRFLEGNKGSLDQWVRRYAVIFGNLWDDKMRMEEEKADGFRSFIFMEWEDAPQFFDHVQRLLDRVRTSLVEKKLEQRAHRKSVEE